MSVIGRLDKQVEDVLISPVSKTRETTKKVPSVEQTENEPTEKARDAEATQNQKTPQRAELPVWLL